MPKPKIPLLFRVVVAMAAMGLLPLAVTYFQLRTNADALTDQVQRTLIVASRAAAAQVDTYLEGLLTLARSTASHPLLLSSPRSTAAQEMLQGILLAQPAVRVVAVFDDDGETVVMVRRTGMQEEIEDFHQAEDMREVVVVRGASRRWLRVRTALPQDAGQLALLADAEIISEKVQAFQIGRQALLALASRDADMVFGGARSLEEFPAALIERARAGKLDSGSQEYTDPRTGDVIAAHMALENAPWFVLSRQPASVARVAQQRIRMATRVAAVGAILLAAFFSGAAYLTVVRPLRRLAAAQKQLVGGEASAGGSEIDQLEASFEVLQQRIRDSEELGRVFLGRYEVTGLIGSGAMGSVFQGWDPKLKRELALKTMRVNAEDIDQQKLITGLLEEAAISARFNHPNIVTVYDVADQGNAAFIAMELVDGINLEQHLAHHGPLSVEEALVVGAAIANALATAHEHGLVHHDVKPANVLLGRDRSIKVTDFGISELISAATRSDDVICGTPGYIAPECFLGDPYGPTADLFALGLILYEALAGKNPFHGRTLRETILNTATVEPVPIESLRPEVPQELAELIVYLMAKEPGDRPADAAAVAEQLDEMVRERDATWIAHTLDSLPLDTAENSVTRTQLISLSEQV